MFSRRKRNNQEDEEAADWAGYISKAGEERAANHITWPALGLGLSAAPVLMLCPSSKEVRTDQVPSFESIIISVFVGSSKIENLVTTSGHR